MLARLLFAALLAAVAFGVATARERADDGWVVLTDRSGDVIETIVDEERLRIEEESRVDDPALDLRRVEISGPESGPRRAVIELAGPPRAGRYELLLWLARPHCDRWSYVMLRVRPDGTITSDGTRLAAQPAIDGRTVRFAIALPPGAEIGALAATTQRSEKRFDHAMTAWSDAELKRWTDCGAEINVIR